MVWVLSGTVDREQCGVTTGSFSSSDFADDALIFTESTESIMLFLAVSKEEFIGKTAGFGEYFF